MPTDINECEMRDTCQHECMNTPGSHRCLCPAGYRLMGNGKTCQGEDHSSRLSSSLWPVLIVPQLCLCNKLFCCISRCRRVSGAEHPMWSQPNVLQHERKLPVYRHTLPIKLPEGSSHRVDPHRNIFSISLDLEWKSILQFFFFVVGSAWRTVRQMTLSAHWVLMLWSTSCCLFPLASQPIRTSSDWWPTHRTEWCTPEPPSWWWTKT